MAHASPQPVMETHAMVRWSCDVILSDACHHQPASAAVCNVASRRLENRKTNSPELSRWLWKPIDAYMFIDGVGALMRLWNSGRCHADKCITFFHWPLPVPPYANRVRWGEDVRVRWG